MTSAQIAPRTRLSLDITRGGPVNISKPAFLLCIALACSVSMAVSYVSSITNFDGLGYPTFASKSQRPIKPFSKDSYSMQNYRFEVERYVEDSRNYVTAGNNDIGQIGEEKAKAVSSANEVVAEYNNFVRYGY